MGLRRCKDGQSRDNYHTQVDGSYFWMVESNVNAALVEITSRS